MAAALKLQAKLTHPSDMTVPITTKQETLIAMQSLAQTIDRMKVVKSASERFLGLWATECIFTQERPLDALLKDLSPSFERFRDSREDVNDMGIWTM